MTRDRTRQTAICRDQGAPPSDITRRLMITLCSLELGRQRMRRRTRLGWDRLTGNPATRGGREPGSPAG
jgi:hypothetical protein